jgi:hypothetical protein
MAVDGALPMDFGEHETKQRGLSLVLVNGLDGGRLDPCGFGYPIKHCAFGNLNQILVVRGAVYFFLCRSQNLRCRLHSSPFRLDVLDPL